MKNIIFPALILLFAVNACSTCYECTEEVVIYDAQGNPVSSKDNVDEFCTADQNEVKERENEGARCQVQ